jgi:hypothetical protein
VQNSSSSSLKPNEARALCFSQSGRIAHSASGRVPLMQMQNLFIDIERDCILSSNCFIVALTI